MQKITPLGKLNWLNAFGFVLVLGIVFSTVKEQPSLTSHLITVTFIYTLFLYIKEYSSNRSFSFNLIVIASAFLLFLNVSVSGFGDFNYYKKAIMYISTLMLMVYSFNVHINPKTIVFAIIINAFIGIVYLTTYQQGFTLFEGEMLLTLNFSNPNMAGLFILNTILYLLLSFSTLCKPRKFIPTLVLSALLIPLLISLCRILTLTGCRSAMIALLFFIFFIVMDIIFGRRFRLKKWMMAFIAVAPFVFVFVYVIYASSITFDVSFGIENAGKTAVTRLAIWKPIIDNFFHYFTFGDYYGISNGTGMSQLHNTHLDIFASYGMLPLILYILLVVKILWQSYKRANTRFHRASVYAFIACMVTGTFEAGFVAGSGGLFILTNGFILLANSRTNENSAG